MRGRYFLFGIGALFALFVVLSMGGRDTVAAGGVASSPAAPPAGSILLAPPAQGTPTPTPTVVCTGITYQVTATTGATMIQATADIGNHCDDCGTTVNLPFPVTVYNTTYTSAVAGSNGTLDFGSTQANGVNHDCLPVHSDPPAFVAALFPYYDDLRTDVAPSTHGIYSITLGSAPNRQFVLQWHTTYFFSDTQETNFEVILTENSPVLTVIYGANAPVSAGALPATGIQLNLGQYTSYSCDTDLATGLRLDYVPVDCPVPPSPTATATNTPAPGPTNTPTLPPAPTQTPGGPSATPTPTTPIPTPGGPAPVVTSAGAQQAPRISNHILVYEDNATGDWDILAKELTTQQIYPVYRGPGDQRAPAISGDLVVWQDNRNGKWDVYGRHLSGGSEFPIAVGPGDHTHPRVSGAQVVWENSLGGGPTSIVTQNLSTGQPFTLSVAGTTNLAPDLNGTLIVWQSTAATSTLGLPAGPAPAAGWQIVGYDLRTGQAQPLSSGPGDHTAPSVDNTSVVWVTTLSAAGAVPATTDSSIDGVDIGGGRGTPTPIPVAPLNPGHHLSQPRVKGHQVTFVDETVDARGVIVGTNLDTPSAATSLSAPGRDSRNPDIDDGGFVVWGQTNAPGDTHIYGTGCQPTAYTDVQVTDYFFPSVQWLTCVGAISGYADGSFRPYANTTRGQLAKIVAAAEGWAIDTTGGPHFSDVPASNPFYAFVETAFNHGVISGYADGTFRVGANATRGQISKIVYVALTAR